MYNDNDKSLKYITSSSTVIFKLHTQIHKREKCTNYKNKLLI
jgi:hypothetical protein